MSSPYWDAWTWFEWLRQYENGETSLGHIVVRQHNEHPYGLPGVIFITFGSLWGYDLKLISILTAVVYCCSALILFDMVRKAATTPIALLTTVLIGLSLRSSENLLYGFQLGFPLTVLCALIAVHAALHRSTGGLVAMTLALVAGGFCSATFVAVYPAVFAALLWGRTDRPWGSAMVAFLLCVAWLLAFGPRLMASHQPSPDFAARATGFVTLAGSPFFSNSGAARVVGVVVLVTFAAMAVRTLRNPAPSKVALVCVGLCSLGMIGAVAAGRGDMSGTNPSRYAVFAIPLVVATAALFTASLPRLRHLPLMMAAGAYILSGQDALVESRHARALEFQMGFTVVNHGVMSDAEIKVLNPGPAEVIRPIIANMETNRYGVFSRPEPVRLAFQTLENFSAAGAKLTQSGDGGYELTGRGHIAAGRDCAACIVRVMVDGLELPDAAMDEESAGAVGKADENTRNVGFIFYDAAGTALQNLAWSVEGRAPPAIIAATGPQGSAKVEAYLYSPDSERRIKFHSMSIATLMPH